MKELRKLKYRFVLIVMALLFTVTTAVCAGIYLTMYRSGERQANSMLEELARRDGREPSRMRPPNGLDKLFRDPVGDASGSVGTAGGGRADSTGMNTGNTGNSGNTGNTGNSGFAGKADAGADVADMPVPPQEGTPAAPSGDGAQTPALAGLAAVFGFDGFVPGNAFDIAMFRNSFSIRLDSKDAITSISSFSRNFTGDGEADDISELMGEDLDALNGAIRDIISHGRERGRITLNGTSYQYFTMEKAYGRIISLLDRSMETDTLNRLLSTLLLIGGIGLVVLFLVSLYLAERAIRPVGKAWEKQKRFIADASHELKTPLTVIAANTDVIFSNRTETVASQSKWLGYIQSETQRMSKLVNDLLMIAKLDAGENKPLFLPFDLSEAVTAACLPLESLAFEAGRELVTDIMPGVTYVGEETGIRQTVGILVDNAIKHATGEGNVQVTLRREGDSGRIRIAVSNPGEGIPKEDRERIFERFYRLDASRARETGGYGLGLSIAKSVMERHGGSIQVHSEPKGLTVFTMVLPPRKG